MKRNVIEHTLSISVIVSNPQGKTSTGTAVLERTDAKEDFPWLTIVWDDPINLMNYVTYVFQTVLGYSKLKANELMLQVHNEGKAIVSSGSKEKVEIDVRKLQTYGLWATMQQST